MASKTHTNINGKDLNDKECSKVRFFHTACTQITAFKGMFVTHTVVLRR